MSDSNEQIEVRHHQSAQRFETGDEGHHAVLEYRMSGKNTIVFTHTGVPRDLENHGIGSMLAQAALEYAKAQKLTVIPRCPFVQKYIERHPEYAELLPRE
jgi:uncharacterized protein